MKIMNSSGEEMLTIRFSVDEDDRLCAHASFAGRALDLPKSEVAFENGKEGLMVHTGLAGTDKACDVLLEYDDVKALKEVPGKGLVSFALKAFR